MPRETFRIQSGIGAQYFVVHIAATVARLRATMRRCKWEPSPKAVACCWACNSPDEPDLVGVVWLPESMIGAGLVAHELTHAAFRAMEREGLRVQHSDRPDRHLDTTEEQFCEVLERLTRGFWNAYYDRGARRG